MHEYGSTVLFPKSGCAPTPAGFEDVNPAISGSSRILKIKIQYTHSMNTKPIEKGTSVIMLALKDVSREPGHFKNG